MVLRNNIISFEGSRSATRRPVVREEHKGLIQSCRQVLLKAMPRLMDRFFEQLDDALYQLADKAQSNQLQSTYFEAMRLLRKQRDPLESDFNRRFLAHYDAFWDGTSEEKAVERELALDESGFSLVEDEALEEGLALSSMISRGENRFYRDLYALEQRFGFLAGGMRVDAKNNPVAPDALVSRFGECCDSLPVELLIKLVLYKQFESAVVDRLGVMYDELNAMLGEAGVIPNLARPIHRPSHPGQGASGRSRSAGRVEDHRGEYAGDAFEEVDYGQVEGDSQSVYPLLLELLQQRRGELPGGMESHRPPVARTQLLGGLTQLQHQWGVRQDTTPTDLRIELKRVLGQHQGHERQIAQPEEDVIDIISMLFEFILEDRNLPDPMRVLLARLQIPMLKVALLDRRFFSKKSHPARRLLNTLAQAALGWSEDQGRDPGSLYGRIETVVEQVIEGFEDDLDLFERLEQEFDGYLGQERKSATRTEQRTAQVVEGKEKLGWARQTVNDLINRRLVRYQGLPQVVDGLVREAWRDVLLLTLLQQGGKSREWIRQGELLDRLLWSLLPKQEQGERQKLLKAIPDLLKGLRAGLTGISYDQHKMTRLFKELQACHIRSLRGQGEASERVTPDEPRNTLDSDPTRSKLQREEIEADAEPPRGEEKADVAAGDERERYRRLAAEVPVGTWFEWHRDAEVPVRAKLSWRSELSGSCLFVNRRGLKVVELTREGMIEQLRGDYLVPLCGEDVELMDRALTSVLECLQKE